GAERRRDQIPGGVTPAPAAAPGPARATAAPPPVPCPRPFADPGRPPNVAGAGGDAGPAHRVLKPGMEPSTDATENTSLRDLVPLCCRLRSRAFVGPDERDQSGAVGLADRISRPRHAKLASAAGRLSWPDRHQCPDRPQQVVAR